MRRKYVKTFENFVAGQDASVIDLKALRGMPQGNATVYSLAAKDYPWMQDDTEPPVSLTVIDANGQEIVLPRVDAPFGEWVYSNAESSRPEKPIQVHLKFP